MATYNIPGITTSVIDYTTITPTLIGGRSILVAGLSKFGDSKNVMNFTNSDELKYLTGGPNIVKYGPALDYAIGALTVTSNVYFKRLVPSDARFANVVIQDESVLSVQDVSDTTVLTLDPYDYAHFAKAEGDGYNEFYVKYSEAPDIEKIYADDEGEPNYKYNFLRATIYQNSPNGLKTIAGPLVISLIDTDPKTNVPILDITTGETLFVNDKITSKNDFIDVKLNEARLQETKKYINIDDVLEEMNTPEVILKDINTGINYKVKCTSDNSLYLEATQIEGHGKLVLKYYANNATNYTKIWVEDGNLNHDSDLTVNDGYEKLYLTGDRYFADMYIDPATGNIVVEEFKTYRATLYNTLLNNGNFQLANGTYGEHVIIDDKFNFAGPGITGSENTKTLLINYFNEDKIIREVMYPTIDFDYVVDWSSDLDVMNSIINLTDTIGFSMGILSLPYSTNPDNDYKLRTEKLYQSTYNNVLYSGQWNNSHYNSYIGRIIAMPESYYQMLINLKVDNELSITEPPAGIVKGQLPVSNVKLSYIADSADIANLRSVQINTIIKEVSGIYTIDQLTMYKKASKLSRMNVVKVIHRMRKDLPKLLKSYIQTKENNNIISKTVSTTSDYMNTWKATEDDTNPDAIFSDISISTTYIPEEYKLILSIRVVPIGTIEKIDIPIIVENK